MDRPPFPSVIDSTIMAAIDSCETKAVLEFFHHYKLRDPSVHLHAGAAYAKGLEVARTEFYVNETPHDAAVAAGVGACAEAYGAFECPDDSAKSLIRTCGALEYYFERYPMDADDAIPSHLPGGKRGIEFSFAEPIDFLHPETQEPLIYSGRMDMIVDFQGMRLGEDDKTTSMLGASWSRQWDLRSQFTGYCWGAARAGVLLQGFLVRGVSILKTKYDTAQAITYRPQWQIDRWYEQLIKKLTRIRDAWESNSFQMSLDHACAEYGGCPFRSVCLMQEPQALLNQQFQRRKWDPIHRIETVLE